ncbi:MAG: glycosyltransferase family 4 protein [Ginsengibacter sp.]
MKQEIEILHLCSGFSDQRIYNQLISNLDALGVKQTVYVPVRSKDRINKNKNESLQKVEYAYSFVLRPFHRLLFHLKIRTVYRDLLKKVNVDKINKVHAHFLFSDGAVALKLKRAKGIPYIVAVRNTDVNIFFKYLVHLRKAGIEILREADRIIFVTPSYQELLFKRYIPKTMHDKLSEKISVIPNGVEPFWLNNTPKRERRIGSDLKILYVGDFSRNKNLLLLITCIEKLNREGFNYKLTLVGGGGNGEREVIEKVASSNSGYLKIIPHVTDRETLRKIYQEHDIFVMVSQKETFGVVYLEALSQGLPIIYTKGQGIDGYFNNGKVGYSANPNDISDITTKIIKITSCELVKMSAEAITEVEKFNWVEISKRYLRIYKSKETN